MSGWYPSFGKRLADILLGGFLLVLTLPVQAVIALLVRRRLGSPVLFRQQRPGRNGQPFTLLKFRTMRDERDASGQPLSDAERLTAFGRRLRASSLDELPELVNVVRGDMSLIGPRPLLVEYLLLYSDEQARRHRVRPGLTGWAQVNGRNALTWPEKLRFDTWYVDRLSWRLDARIAWMTVSAVLARRGIGQDGGDLVEFFRGER